MASLLFSRGEVSVSHEEGILDNHVCDMLQERMLLGERFLDHLAHIFKIS